MVPSFPLHHSLWEKSFSAFVKLSRYINYGVFVSLSLNTLRPQIGPKLSLASSEELVHIWEHYVLANWLEDLIFLFLIYLVLSQALWDHYGIFKSKDLTIFSKWQGFILKFKSSGSNQELSVWLLLLLALWFLTSCFSECFWRWRLTSFVRYKVLLKALVSVDSVSKIHKDIRQL